MYLFGKSTASVSLTADDVRQVVSQARGLGPALAQTPIDAIVEVLDRLSRSWAPRSVLWRKAFEMTRGEVAFSDEMVAHSLNVIPELLRRKNVEARLKSDFHRIEKLDHFVPSHSFLGRERAFPLGVLFHVSAGNVFLGAIDSLLMGFLTKNVSVVKLSSRNVRFPTLFAESLREADPKGCLADKFALLHFAGGSTSLENEIKQSVNAIIAWGGEDMILSYKRGLPVGTKFIEYGPKISCQVVTANGLKGFGDHDLYASAGRAIAADVALWDQAACASPQNLFVEEGTDVPRFLEAIAAGFEEFPMKRGELSDDEHVEILKEKARGEYNKIQAGGELIVGKEFLLHFDPIPGLRPSPLNRSLIVKRFRNLEDLKHQLWPFARYLQSCGVLLTSEERETYLDTLGEMGIMRFAPIGHVMEAPIGAPHDGRMTLTELTRLVPEERDGTVVGHVNDAIANVPFYGELRGGTPITELREMPLVSGKDFDTGDRDKLKRFLRRDSEGGYVFSSGGTSGAPKFSVYSHDEFSAVGDLLAKGFTAQGIKKGAVVANLFVAGNMWSSFLAVDQALSKIGARTLPIGGMTDRGLTLRYCEQFPPDAIVGLPTQLVELARRARELGKALQIPFVFYAGEHLSVMARSFLKEVFATKTFGSAGYASVDGGPIGYQCSHNPPGVHHLFEDQVHLEIIDGQGVITSLIKREMPVIRLRTGDLLEVIDGSCPCRSSDRLFKLLGRADSQFNMWGCRMFIEDVERSLADLGLDGALFQIVLRQSSGAEETLLIRVEHDEAAKVSVDVFSDHFYEVSKDVKATHPRPWLAGKIVLEALPAGGIDRVTRTGKIRLLVDER